MERRSGPAPTFAVVGVTRPKVHQMILQSSRQTVIPACAEEFSVLNFSVILKIVCICDEAKSANNTMDYHPKCTEAFGFIYCKIIEKLRFKAVLTLRKVKTVS